MLCLTVLLFLLTSLSLKGQTYQSDTYFTEGMEVDSVAEFNYRVGVGINPSWALDIFSTSKTFHMKTTYTGGGITEILEVDSSIFAPRIGLVTNTGIIINHKDDVGGVTLTSGFTATKTGAPFPAAMVAQMGVASSGFLNSLQINNTQISLALQNLGVETVTQTFGNQLFGAGVTGVSIDYNPDTTGSIIHYLTATDIGGGSVNVGSGAGLAGGDGTNISLTPTTFGISNTQTTTTTLESAAPAGGFIFTGADALNASSALQINNTSGGMHRFANDGEVQFGGDLLMTGGVAPTDTVDFDLGSGGMWWDDLYVKRINASGFNPKIGTGLLPFAEIFGTAITAFDALQGDTLTGGDLLLQSNTSNDGEIVFGSLTGMVYDETNGRLSIGADVNTIIIGGATVGSKITTHSEGSTDLADVAIRRYTDVAGAGGHLLMCRGRGTRAAETIVQNGDILGRLDFLGWDGTDCEMGAQIDAVIDSVPDNNSMPTRLMFLTTPVGATISAERMRIDRNGLVGIGVTPTTALHVDNNGANTLAIMRLENTGGDFDWFRSDADPEAVITASVNDLAVAEGDLYIKNTGNATNTGWAMVGGGAETIIDLGYANSGNAGTFYVGGGYNFSATDITLTIGGAVTQTFGAVGESHAAHFFAVASGAGGTDLVLTVSGISINDQGVKNGADSEVIVADTDEATTDQYFESTKKWLGEVTYTLTGAAGAFTFNYGHVKYNDLFNRDFTLVGFEATGRAGQNETALDVQVLIHDSSRFVYSAAAFIPNQTPLVSLAGDHGADGDDVPTGEIFAWKRDNLDATINGAGEQGIIIALKTAVNNSIVYANFSGLVIFR